MSLKEKLQEEFVKTKKLTETSEPTTSEYLEAMGYLSAIRWMEGLIDEEESPTEEMLKEITKVARAVQELDRNEFTKKILILYIHDKTKLGKQKIEMVLEIIDEFGKEMSGD